MPQSTRGLRTPSMLRQAPVDAFEQIAELRRRHRYCPIRRRWPDEATTLQALGEQAHAQSIVPKHLDQAASPPSEHEQMAIREDTSSAPISARIIRRKPARPASAVELEERSGQARRLSTGALARS